jgi:hypothetical protein
MLKGSGTNWGGQPYYSKNTVTGTGDAQYMLTGACTIEGTVVKLVWAVNWGILTMNSMFDIANGDGTYSAYAFPIPYNSDDTVNVSALNTSVMYNCPSRGAFVMLDLVTRSFVYTFMDGESLQYAVQSPAGLVAGKVAGTTNLRSEPASDDQTSLPLTSSLPGLPQFTTGAVASGAQRGLLSSWSINTNPSGIDYTHVWLPFVQGYGRQYYNGVQTNTYGQRLADVQSGTGAATVQSTSPATAVVTGDTSATNSGNWPGGTYYGLPYVTAWAPGSTNTIYSGWLSTGSATATQMVGYVSNGYIFCTPYGYKSASPTATNSSGTQYNLTTVNTQAEILSCMPNTVGFQAGFTYDASVGSYGQVTWLSQI